MNKNLNGLQRKIYSEPLSMSKYIYIIQVGFRKQILVESKRIIYEQKFTWTVKKNLQWTPKNITVYLLHASVSQKTEFLTCPRKNSKAYVSFIVQLPFFYEQQPLNPRASYSESESGVFPYTKLLFHTQVTTCSVARRCSILCIFKVRNIARRESVSLQP